MTEEQVKQLTKSIEKFNLVEIPAIDTDNKIVAGHQRLNIMQLLGRGEEIIDVRIPNRKLTDAEFKEYNVRSNKNTGIWDDELLASLFSENELREFGFSEIELGMMEFKDNDEMLDDVVPQMPDEEPKSKLGDLYELPGGHRILCGDSLLKEDVDKLMNGVKIDLVFTDPPYNVDYQGLGQNTSTGILNDKMSFESFSEFLTDAFERYAENSKRETAWYVFHSPKTQDQFKEAINKTDWKVKTQLIWNKPSAGLGANEYRQKHEPFFYCGTDDVKFYGDRTGTTVWDFQKDTDAFVKWAKKVQEADSQGKTTIWTMKREPVEEYVHPTQKPVELIEKAIINSSKAGEVVADFFLGSGATLIASLKKNRICYGMELDPKYVDTIIERYCFYTDNRNVIKNGEEIKWE